MIKRWIKEWLGIETNIEENVEGKISACKEYLEYELKHHRESLTEEIVAHSSVEVDYLMMEQKFDALCELLGITIGADLMTGEGRAIVSSVRDDGILGEQKDYIDKAITAQKIIALHFKMLRETQRLMEEIDWRKPKGK